MWIIIVVPISLNWISLSALFRLKDVRKWLRHFVSVLQTLWKDVGWTLFEFHSFASDRHPALFGTTSRLLRTLFSLDDTAQLDISRFNFSQAGYSAVFAANLARMSPETLTSSYDESVANIRMALERRPVCGVLAVISLAELLSTAISSPRPLNMDQPRGPSSTETFRRGLVEMWSLLFHVDGFSTESGQLLLARSVDVLSMIMPLWNLFDPDSQRFIIDSIGRCSWKCLPGQKSWALLLHTVPHPNTPRPRDLLKNLPLNFHRVQLAELISLIATPKEVAEILTRDPECSPFFMKSVLPRMAKESGFVGEVLRCLKEEEDDAFTGYGPVFFTLRSLKIQNITAVRADIFRDYVRGREELAVVADDLTRLEVFGFLCEVAEPLADFDREFIRLIDWLVQRLNGRVIHRLIDWLIDPLIHWLIDWLIDLID